MMLNKQILEAIHRGIQLALDDFEDIENNSSISQHNDIIATKDIIQQKIDKKKFDTIANNIYQNNLSKNDLDTLISLSNKWGFKHSFCTKNPQNVEYYWIVSKELSNFINRIVRIDKYADLNWIDLSKIRYLHNIFENSEFNGDISKWDVSHIVEMQYMFKNSEFNGDISKWDVSECSSFYEMFKDSKFNRDISKWEINRGADIRGMFENCPINQMYKPYSQFNKGLWWANKESEKYSIQPNPSSYETVDLKLPSGTLWCKYNMGVNPNNLNNSEDWYGDYYAWGEIYPKEGFDYENYKFSLMENMSTPYNTYFSKYSFDKYNYYEKYIKKYSNFNLPKPDYMKNLSLEDDAAYQNMDHQFKMPSAQQFIELLRHTKHYWKNNYNGVQGLNGRVFKGKNGKELFLPAAGYIYTNGGYNRDKSEIGEYLSTQLYGDNKNGYDDCQVNCLNITKGKDTCSANTGSYRYSGYPIRPVKIKNKKS